MNILVPMVIVALLVIFFYFKMNNLRTKVAFFFIFLGVILIFLFAFLFSSGSTFDFSTLGKIMEGTKVYLLWAKSAFVNVVEFTGKITGIDWIQEISNNVRK